jgi:hypothetical protein
MKKLAFLGATFIAGLFLASPAQACHHHRRHCDNDWWNSRWYYSVSRYPWPTIDYDPWACGGTGSFYGSPYSGFSRSHRCYYTW